jgi:hypothetical protein
MVNSAGGGGIVKSGSKNGSIDASSIIGGIVVVVGEEEGTILEGEGLDEISIPSAVGLVRVINGTEVVFDDPDTRVVEVENIVEEDPFSKSSKDGAKGKGV